MYDVCLFHTSTGTQSSNTCKRKFEDDTDHHMSAAPSRKKQFTSQSPYDGQSTTSNGTYTANTYMYIIIFIFLYVCVYIFICIYSYYFYYIIHVLIYLYIHTYIETQFIPRHLFKGDDEDYANHMHGNHNDEYSNARYDEELQQGYTFYLHTLCISHTTF